MDFFFSLLQIAKPRQGMGRRAGGQTDSGRPSVHRGLFVDHSCKGAKEERIISQLREILR